MQTLIGLLLSVNLILALASAAETRDATSQEQRHTRGLQEVSQNERQLKMNFRKRGSQYLPETCSSPGMPKRDRSLGLPSSLSSAKDVFCEYANVECETSDSVIELFDAYQLCLYNEMSMIQAKACRKCLVVVFDNDECRVAATEVCNVVDNCAEICGDCLSVGNAYFSCAVKQDFHCFEFVCDAVVL